MAVRNPKALIIGAALLLPNLAFAAPPKAAPAKAARPAAAATPKVKLDLPSLKKALDSGDEPKTLEALDTIAKSGDPAGASGLPRRSLFVTATTSGSSRLT